MAAERVTVLTAPGIPRPGRCSCNVLERRHDREPPAPLDDERCRRAGDRRIVGDRLKNISTNGTSGDGVLVGQGGVLTADKSHFDQVQLGSGPEAPTLASSATITNSTFDGNGTSPNATQSSNESRRGRRRYLDGDLRRLRVQREYEQRPRGVWQRAGHGGAERVLRQSQGQRGDLPRSRRQRQSQGQHLLVEWRGRRHLDGSQRPRVLRGCSGIPTITRGTPSSRGTPSRATPRTGSTSAAPRATSRSPTTSSRATWSGSSSIRHRGVDQRDGRREYVRSGNPRTRRIYWQGIVAVGTGNLTATIGGGGMAKRHDRELQRR